MPSPAKHCRGLLSHLRYASHLEPRGRLRFSECRSAISAMIDSPSPALSGHPGRPRTFRASSLICQCISSFPSLFRLDQGNDGWVSETAGWRVKILRCLLVFCVWLGWMYLMAMINEALFAIFLGSSMIIGGIHIPPRSGRDPASAYRGAGL